MPFGLIFSFACHAALLLWAYGSMSAVRELPSEETPVISAELVTPSEFLKLKQGSENAKQLEAKAKAEQKLDDSKNDTKKPDNTPPLPPPPQEVAKAEPVPEPPKPPEVVPPPEPPKPEPPKTDPIAEQLKLPPPPPEPAPGPTPEDKKLLEQKLEEQRKADEAKKAAEEAAKKKAAEDAAKKKAADDAKKRAEELKKKRLAEAAKNKFDLNKIAADIAKAPGDTPPKALVDKDPRLKGQQAAGTSQTALNTGKEAGTATGKDTVLSAREQDLLAGLIKNQLSGCWRLPGGGGGTEPPVVTLKWRLKPDGHLDGEPSVVSGATDQMGQVAAEAAMRAVRECQPFKLPPDKYENWKGIEWVFDPRQML